MHPDQCRKGEAASDWFPCYGRIRRNCYRISSPFLRTIHSTSWKERQKTPATSKTVPSNRKDDLYLHNRGSSQRQAHHNKYSQPETFQLRPWLNVTVGSRPTERTTVRSRSNHRPQRQSQQKINRSNEQDSSPHTVKKFVRSGQYTWSWLRPVLLWGTGLKNQSGS